MNEERGSSLGGESSQDVVRWLGRAVPPGHTAAIGLVVEPTPAVVDALAWDLGVAVLRRSRDQIEQEIAAAEARRRPMRRPTTPGAGQRQVTGAVLNRQQAYCRLAGEAWCRSLEFVHLEP